MSQATFTDGLWDGRPVGDWVPEVVADVVRGFDPARVIVFGSVARGEQDQESDLDLLVLFDDIDAGDGRRLMGRIRTAIAAPIPIDVLVADVAEFEAGKDVNGASALRARVNARGHRASGSGQRRPPTATSDGGLRARPSCVGTAVGDAPGQR